MREIMGIRCIVGLHGPFLRQQAMWGQGKEPRPIGMGIRAPTDDCGTRGRPKRASPLFFVRIRWPPWHPMESLFSDSEASFSSWPRFSRGPCSRQGEPPLESFDRVAAHATDRSA